MEAYNILIATLSLIIGIIIGLLQGRRRPDALTQRLEEAKLQAEDVPDEDKPMACQQYQALKDGIMQVETGNLSVTLLTPEQRTCLNEILEILCSESENLS